MAFWNAIQYGFESSIRVIGTFGSFIKKLTVIPPPASSHHRCIYFTNLNAIVIAIKSITATLLIEYAQIISYLFIECIVINVDG